MCCVESGYDNQHSGGIPLTSVIFCDQDLVLQLMTNDMLCGKTVLQGVKENIAFLLDNKDNTECRANGKRSHFVDDCGVWAKPSSKPSFN